MSTRAQVEVPKDKKVKRIIDRLGRYVARDGFPFEQLIMEREVRGRLRLKIAQKNAKSILFLFSVAYDRRRSETISEYAVLVRFTGMCKFSAIIFAWMQGQRQRPELEKNFSVRLIVSVCSDPSVSNAGWARGEPANVPVPVRPRLRGQLLLPLESLRVRSAAQHKFCDKFRESTSIVAVGLAVRWIMPSPGRECGFLWILRKSSEQAPQSHWCQTLLYTQ